MRSPRAADDRGSVAAEFAVALPAVVLVLGVCLGGIGVGSQQLRLQDAAAAAARGLGRGETAGAVAAQVTRMAGGATLERWAADGLVCVRLSRAAEGPIAAAGLRLAAESCALDGGR
jgi:hypothetical protein